MSSIDNVKWFFSSPYFTKGRRDVLVISLQLLCYGNLKEIVFVLISQNKCFYQSTLQTLGSLNCWKLCDNMPVLFNFPFTGNKWKCHWFLLHWSLSLDIQGCREGNPVELILVLWGDLCQRVKSRVFLCLMMSRSHICLHYVTDLQT